MSQLKNISEDTREHLKALQNEMYSCAEKLELPLVHYFVNGVYGREIFIPAGVLVAGRIHKTEHISIISQGIVEVVTDNVITGEVLRETYEAPYTFVSPIGTKRMVQALTDTVWTTFHKYEGEQIGEGMEDVMSWPDYESFEQNLLTESEKPSLLDEVALWLWQP